VSAVQRCFGLGLATVLVVIGLLAVGQAGSQVNDSSPKDRDQGRLSAAEALADRLGSTVIDLTHTFNDQTIYWPTDPPFEWTKAHWGPTEHGWYASGRYSASEHGGTHIDAPIHFAKGQITVDQIPIRSLIGPAVVIDVTEACQQHRDYQLQVSDIKAWESEHGPIPDGAIVLMHTGWSRYWPDTGRYLGSPAPADVEDLHFPGIGPEVAQWLVDHRDIDGIGLDTASLDHGPTETFPTHRILGKAGIFGLENVANLDQLPASGATVIALPMKIGGGSGGPTRIIAIPPVEPKKKKGEGP